ncbi:uncharacterized protein LOC8289594 [Ricinus communis]|uniref:Uncharacterized protein n=1 Tax=Ricinus communis TaxID=3988 RepID=B9SNP6_RICCO|nr:uncharacterized protein LOC8289594 [Ricinus communis]EEF34754.1 conserved hypothetical protein [Ricinus communis]|eukprot:XP_002527615.1 uncharacterized protein LOC8289594 [Ricinus communis]
MENLQETPKKEPMQSEANILECKTPPQDQKMDSKSLNSSGDLRKSSTPDRLKVPKAFKYPERYRSPTDLMVSPITKGLLARNRKGAALLPPSMNQAKVPDIAQDVVSFKIEI